MHWAHLEASALGSLCCLPRMEGRKVHSISTLLKMICVFQLSLSLHFYLIYLLLNSCDKNDITLCSWNSPAALAGNYGLYLSRSVSTIQSSWLHNLWTDAVSVIPAAVTSDLKQRLIDTSASISQNVINEAAGQWKKQLHASTKANDITLNICQTKTCSFQSQHAAQPVLFRATNSLLRKTRCFASFPSQPLRQIN